MRSTSSRRTSVSSRSNGPLKTSRSSSSSATVTADTVAAGADGDRGELALAVARLARVLLLGARRRRRRRRVIDLRVAARELGHVVARIEVAGRLIGELEHDHVVVGGGTLSVVDDVELERAAVTADTGDLRRVPA